MIDRAKLEGGSDTTTVFTTSGSAALEKIVQLESLEGSSVMLPAFICREGFEPIFSGYDIEPVFVDVDPATMHLDLELARPLLPDVEAAIVVHAFGLPVDIDQWLEQCRRHNVILIEDCARALGARVDGKPVGETGDYAIYSLKKVSPVFTGGCLRCNFDRTDIELDPADLSMDLLVQSIFYQLPLSVPDVLGRAYRRLIGSRTYRDVGVHDATNDEKPIDGTTKATNSADTKNDSQKITTTDGSAIHAEKSGREPGTSSTMVISQDSIGNYRTNTIDSPNRRDTKNALTFEPIRQLDPINRWVFDRWRQSELQVAFDRNRSIGTAVRSVLALHGFHVQPHADGRAYYELPALAPDRRDELVTYLRERNYPATIIWDDPWGLEGNPAAGSKSYPGTAALAERIMQFQLSKMTHEDVDSLADDLYDFYGFEKTS